MSTTRKIGRGTPGFDPRTYRDLVADFPPLKIRDATQAEATEAEIERLLSKRHPSGAERALADLLSDLLAEWEDITVEIPDVSGPELVRALMEDNGLRQRDLVGVFPTESVVSEVLAGRRELTRRHIEALADYFHVSPAAFFQRSRSTRAGGV
jgi:HTH-type transcriptional regulator/antitoxin HigA